MGGREEGGRKCCVIFVLQSRKSGRGTRGRATSWVQVSAPLSLGAGARRKCGGNVQWMVSIRCNFRIAKKKDLWSLLGAGFWACRRKLSTNTDVTFVPPKNFMGLPTFAIKTFVNSTPSKSTPFPRTERKVPARPEPESTPENPPARAEMQPRPLSPDSLTPRPPAGRIVRSRQPHHFSRLTTPPRPPSEQ